MDEHEMSLLQQPNQKRERVELFLLRPLFGVGLAGSRAEGSVQASRQFANMSAAVFFVASLGRDLGGLLPVCHLLSAAAS
jgi:hypothetical protein